MSAINDLARSEYTYRGTTFILQEVDVATYDKCLQKATKKVEDPVTGQDTDDVDENLLLRLLLRESLIEPKISDFSTLGLRLMRQLERDVRALHFDVEPKSTPEAKGRRKKVETPEEDDSPNPED